MFSAWCLWFHRVIFFFLRTPLFRRGGTKCLWQILGALESCVFLSFLFVWKCERLVPDIAEQDRLCSAVFIKGEFKIIHKEKKVQHSMKNPILILSPPLFFKDSNTLLVDRELEPISRRRGVFVHVRESIVRLLHHFLCGSGQADLCKQSEQWQITQLELTVPCGNRTLNIYIYVSPPVRNGCNLQTF